MSYKKAMEANIWRYYAFWALKLGLVFVPFIFYYFQTLGFSLAMIAMLQSAMALTLVIAEIPSGYFADRYGRKISLILSVVLEMIALIILYSATGFPMLVMAHITTGLALAFASGADSAFLYDTLLALKKEKQYKRIEGKAKFFGEMGVITAAVLGALVVQFGVPLTILLSLFGQVILLVVVLGMKEPKRHKLVEILPWKKEVSLLKSIIIRSLYNKYLLGLFIYSALIMGGSNTIFVMSQPYFNATNIPVPLFGIIFAVFSIFTAVAALKAHYIEEKLGIFGSLLIMPLFLVVAYLGAGAFFVWFGFMFFFFREAVRGFVFPVLGDYTNRLAESHERATVLSIRSLFSRVGFVIVSISFGLASDNYGLRIGLIATGFALLGFTVIVPLLVRHRFNRKTLKTSSS